MVEDQTRNSPVAITASIPFVVGIGASAGGLEAITQVFDAIEEEHGFAFVIVQHLSPDHKSLMDELLAKHTNMPVIVAEEGMQIKANTIFLIPNKSLLTLKAGHFHLTDKLPRNLPSEAVDIFFQSLAQEMGDRAVGIILSGTGSDGTRGIKEIKAGGGLTIAQEPSSAKFDGMPRSAITSGNIDLVLNPNEIGHQLFSLAKNSLRDKLNQLPELEQNMDKLHEIISFIRMHTQFDFSAYKEQTLFRRVKRRSDQLELDSLEEYYYYLKNHPEEAELLGRDFLIGVTRFFRDAPAYEVLKAKVIPQIVGSKKPNDHIKVWVTACSTGEEAYSLAILFNEEVRKQGKNTSVKIFATDVDSEAIETAARGEFSEPVEEQVPKKFLEAYFTKERGNYTVRPHLRRMVIFAQHNIIKDPPFSRADLVSCRNLLIYMKPALQQKVLATLHFALNLNGYLFLGASESSDELSHSLREVSKKWNIFQITKKSRNYIFNGNVYNGRTVNKVEMQPPNSDLYPKKRNLDDNYQNAFQEVVLEEQGYAVFFVDESLNLLKALGNHKDFLRIPDKVLEVNLLKLLPEEIAIGLNLTARRALRTQERVVSQRMEVGQGDEARVVSLVVKPFTDGQLFPNKVLSVLLRTEGNRPVGELAVNEEVLSRQNLQDNRQLELEEELKGIRQELRSTVEELETSNEEMQSSNEELLSSNEELQSTNEELQSLNEELHTVNAEHQQKIIELQQLNDDLNNYLRSTDIGQIFLDRNLCVRKFTPAIKGQINLIESDIGRPFNHLTYNFRDAQLVGTIEEVIKTGNQTEREIETTSGQYFLMRVMPYYRHDGENDGCIVTFVDISKVKLLNNLLSSVLNSSPNGILTLVPEFSGTNSGKVKDYYVELFNNSSLNLLNLPKDTDLQGNHLSQILPLDNIEALIKQFSRVLTDLQLYRTEVSYTAENQERWLELVVARTEYGLLLTIIDITASKEAEKELTSAYDEVKETSKELQYLNANLESRVAERTKLLAQSEERFRLLSRSTNDAVWDWNLITGEFWWNDGFQEIFGHESTDNETGVQSLYKRLHPDEKQAIINELNEVINTGQKQWTSEHLFEKADGSYAQVYNRGKLLKNEYDVPYRMLGSIVDISNLKETQNKLRQANAHLKRTNSDLDNFVYTASHDLRAPVANLTGLMSLLTPPLNITIEGKDKHLMNMVNNSVQKLKRTIDSLLEVTQSQKELDKNLEWVDIKQVVNDVKADLRDQLVESKGKVKMNLEIEKICYTYSHMRSILLNLISNSIKYRSPDRKILIEVNTREDEEKVIMEVADNGLGLSAKSQEKIFTMFRRFHSHVEGTGIGLYIIKRIIESNEGSITVESEKDVGTTFRIFLKKEKPSE
jgi:two-component system CheB/CheR fusion protein